MPFPVSPNPGDSYTDAYGTVWIYAGSVNGWYRQTVVPNNDTTYTGGGSGSATATGAAGEIQFTDGTNLAASPNLLWDDANDELEVTGDLKLLDGGTYATTLQTITPTANRTVSIPDATGTLALVAGSSGQLVYNNAGVYAGIPGSTVGASGNVTLNASSGFTGNLLDLQVGGTSNLRFAAGSTGALNLRGSTEAGEITCASQSIFQFYGSGYGTQPVRVTASGGLSLGSLGDTTLIRDDADKLAQRNGTSAQTFRVYNTYTSSTNYELGKLEWSSNAFRIGTEKGSGGGTARNLELQTDGITRIRFAGTEAQTSYLDAGGTAFVNLNPNSNIGIRVASGYGYSFTAGAANASNPDASLVRDAAAVVKVTDGSTGNGTLLAQHRLAGTAPATSTSTGTAGDIRYDADYIYVCTATNTWKRAALAATW